MAENSLPVESSQRRAAAKALTVVGLAYMAAIVIFYVLSAYAHGLGQLVVKLFAAICIAPATLFLIAQYSVRLGKAIGRAIFLNCLVGGLVAFLLLSGLRRLFCGLWDVVTTEDWDNWHLLPWDELFFWAILVALVFLHVRALIAFGSLVATQNAQPVPAPVPRDFPWDKPDLPN